MNMQREELIEKLDQMKTSLENDTNYAVLWLGETLDFLNNGDLNMGLWAYSKYLEVFQRMDMDRWRQVSQQIQAQLEELRTTGG